MGLPVPSLYRTKESPREDKTGFGLQRTEEVYEAPALLDGAGDSGTVSTPGRGLVSVTGPSGCILACPPTTPIPPVSDVTDGEEDISIHQLPFRILACTEGLHEASEGGKSTFFGSRRHHIHVP